MPKRTFILFWQRASTRECVEMESIVHRSGNTNGAGAETHATPWGSLEQCLGNRQGRCTVWNPRSTQTILESF